MSSDLLVLFDSETTGLDPKTDDILEVACQVVRGHDLEPVAEPFHRALGWSSTVVRALMTERPLQAEQAGAVKIDPWVIKTHRESGLTAACEASRQTIDDVGIALTAYLDESGIPLWNAAMDAKPLLAGSSVHFDRSFLEQRMPFIARRLHYRNVDTSTLRSLCRLWAPELTYEPAKTHRALEDVTEVLAELRHYREALFWPIRTVA